MGRGGVAQAAENKVESHREPATPEARMEKRRRAAKESKRDGCQEASARKD